MEQPSSQKPHLSTSPDVLIVGAGIIGLTLALELHRRGAQVVIIERDTALSHASSAAAGMLAALDPHNPPQLLELSRYSAALYPDFLTRLESLSSSLVPIQTRTTVQYLSGGGTRTLQEDSLDPRQLGAALLRAAHTAGIPLLENVEFHAIEKQPNSLQLVTNKAEPLHARQVVMATGAWGVPAALLGGSLPIVPKKGQMLRVQLPASLAALREVHRTEEVYIVPRTAGPQAGTALIGATVENAGFDLSTHPADLAALRALASRLLPGLASATEAPQVEAWAGLRPATHDHLPVLGPSSHPDVFLAIGHFRNGILLAPATAKVLADRLEGKTSAVDLTPFSASRFLPPTAPAL